MAPVQPSHEERNWADLMDALLRENFSAHSRAYTRKGIWRTPVSQDTNALQANDRSDASAPVSDDIKRT